MKRYGIEERALGRIIEDMAIENRGKVFLEYQDDPPVTYDSLNEMVNRVANGLLKLGIRKNDKVAIFMMNSPEYLYAWFGAAKIGAVEVPVNTALKGYLLEHVLNLSESKVIIVDAILLERLEFVQDNLKTLEKVIVFSGKEPVDEKRSWEGRLESLNFNWLMEQATENPGIHVDYYDPICILFTSGTTGPSKGAVLTHNMYYLNGVDCADAMGYTSEDILLTCLPLFHANAQLLSVCAALVADAKMALYERFSATHFWSWVKKHKATAFNSLGAMTNFIWMQSECDEEKDNPVRIALIAPAPKKFFHEFEDRFKMKIIDGYGSTEAGMVFYNPRDAVRLKSCGKTVPRLETKIVDDHDNEIPIGEVGELLVRPRTSFGILNEYYRMPEATVKTFRNLWFHTGDAFYRDQEGYYFFVDRIKDAIRRRGENISSYEVEMVINQHPAVLESAVFAVKSEYSEDEVKATVVLKEGVKVDPLDLIKFCEPRMPYFAIPRYIEFVDQIPKTPTEKMEKYKLKEMGITEKTWDREKVGYKIKR
ncbi:MAG: AMP-binding protein [Pseudomonadota bacterium]